MELKIEKYQAPQKITFNYEDLKTALIEKCSLYETMVYTDEQITLAKADRADLNRLKKALNDERIRREKEYMQPFNEFKAQIAEIIGIIDKPVALIDRQIKDVEESKKQEKLEKILALWNGLAVPEWLGIKQLFNEKWLNASVSMKTIEDELSATLNRIEKDLASLSNLPEYAFEATEVYKTTLDLAKALEEAHRLSQTAKKKAEFEEVAKKAAESTKKATEAFCNLAETVATIEPSKQWVAFEALLSVEDAQTLKQFFKSRNIEYKAIKKG